MGQVDVLCVHTLNSAERRDVAASSAICSPLAFSLETIKRLELGELKTRLETLTR
jgi:hypothetical protein